MAIRIVRKPRLVEQPEPVVEYDEKTHDTLRKMMIELARQAAWKDHVASLRERKTVA